MTTAGELKPCPFCGQHAELRITTSSIAFMGDITWHKVGCPYCLIFAERRDVNEAIKAWNRRVENGNG